MVLAARNLTTPDHIVLVAYFLLMLGIGLYFYRFMRGLKDYFSGGNTIPWWLSGVSFYMSSFSVSAFIFYPALCYRYGWVGITLLWVAVPATLFSVLLFARKWRRARIDSPVEYLETRYSTVLRQLFAWQGVPVKVVDDGIKLVAIGMFLEASLGIDLQHSMIASGLIILAYTFMGGLWAVAVTDFIQFIVLTVALVVILPLSLVRASTEAGGFKAIFDKAPEGFFSLTAPEYDWIYVGLLIILYCFAWSSVNWPLIQRYYCVPKEKDAHKVGWLVVALYIVGPPLMFLPAMAARYFLSDIGDQAIYPVICTTLLPAGMLGLVIAAMFSATMSMLSSDYNVCANVLTNDVYRRLARPRASQKELVLVGRIMTLIVGLAALWVAGLAAKGTGEDLFRTMVTLFSVATAPVAVPMLLGLLSRRVTNRAALVGFTAGLAIGVGLFFLSRVKEPGEFLAQYWDPAKKELMVLGLRWKMEIVIFTASAIVSIIAVSLTTILKPMGTKEQGQVDAFFARLATPIGDLEEDRESERADERPLSPFRVVGLSILLLGVVMLCVLPWMQFTLAFFLDAGLGATLILIGFLLLRAGSREGG